MGSETNALEIYPRESMLTYAVLLGQQARKRDPYALSAQITDLAIRGCLSIQESKNKSHDSSLSISPYSSDASKEETLEEEALFIGMFRDSTPDNANGVGLDGLTANKELTASMPVLWERVVMMHHVSYNKHRPLYNTDPTLSLKWQGAIRVLGGFLAAASVYAQPGWQGVVGGLAAILATREVPKILTDTGYGRALKREIGAVRGHMLRLANAGELDATSLPAYERALPFAFLVDDDLTKKWPDFLSQHYTQYPPWLIPARPAGSVALRQTHIASMLRAISTVHFPAHKQRAIPR